jgi:hypothetical protein
MDQMGEQPLHLILQALGEQEALEITPVPELRVALEALEIVE